MSCVLANGTKLTKLKSAIAHALMAGLWKRHCVSILSILPEGGNLI